MGFRSRAPLGPTVLAALLLAGAVLAGCGRSGSSESSESGGAIVQPRDAHGEPRAQAREHARDPAVEFLAALAAGDASRFCQLALPELQRSNFVDVDAPAGDCEERAAAMFRLVPKDGEDPSWYLLSQGKVAGIKLNCPGATSACGRATVRIEDLPLRGGGTTSAPTPVSFAGGSWRVGKYWVEVDGEPPAIARKDPVAAAQGFLDSLIEQDAANFCELTLPAAQRSTFESSNAPPGASCKVRALAMFDRPVPEGSAPPLWAREARAVLGPINLHCVPGTERCPKARIRIEALPLAGGGTTIAPMTIVHSDGRWRVGAIEAGGLGGGKETADQT